MPCSSFRELALRVDAPGRFISDDQEYIAIDELRSKAILDAHQAWRRSVLLKTKRQLPTAMAAMELDGIAHRIVLCTPDHWQHIPSIVEQAAIDLIVADQPETNPVPTMQVNGLHCPVWHTTRDCETEWILLTSGTTGVPKMAIHTLASLAGPLEDGLVVTGAVWSTFYDVRRYGGLQMLLRALLGGGSMILSSSDETASQFLQRIGKGGVTHISGTPSHWRRALMSPAISAVTPSYVRMSGEIVDQSILDHLHRTFPTANFGWAFASTEAGVAFDVRDGKAGFPACYIGSPSLKAELRVDGDTLHIRSSRTARGYVGAPLNGYDGFVDTGDRVKRLEDRYYFAGRREGVINVGGQKVYPEEVEVVLTQYPAVRMARVWGRKSPVTGALVAADVILQFGTLVDIQSDLLAHCRRHLAAWKVPVTMREVDSIALSPAGKIFRA
jgi:acyl-CoA synthetase (AMP-forming)/AMP-acid ligase II